LSFWQVPKNVNAYLLISCTETDGSTENLNPNTDRSTAAPAIGNPEYFAKDAGDNPWKAARGATTGVDDEGSYLTCGAAAGAYYDYSGGVQMITA